MYPGDKISVSPGLRGGGRKKEIHNGAPCSSCFICKSPASSGNRYIHLCRKMEKHMDFVEYVKLKHPDIKDDSCVCRTCERKIERMMQQQSVAPTDLPPSKKPRTACAAMEHLGFTDCGDSTITTEWDLKTVAAGLMYQGEVEPVNSDVLVSLCKKHYHCVYDVVKGRNMKCCACNISLSEKYSNSRKFSCNFSGCDQDFFVLLSSKASSYYKQTLTVERDSIFCKKCYDPFIKIISQDKLVFQNPAVHTPLLLDIIAEYPADEDMDSCPDTTQIEEAAFSATVSYLAQTFL